MTLFRIKTLKITSNCKVSIRFNNIAHNTFAIRTFNGTLPSSSSALVIAVSEINVDKELNWKANVLKMSGDNK